MQIKILPVTATAKDGRMSVFLVDSKTGECRAYDQEKAELVMSLVRKLPESVKPGGSKVWIEERVGVVGIDGEASDSEQAERVRRGLAAILNQMRPLEARSFGLDLSSRDSLATAAVEAAGLSDYVFTGLSRSANEEYKRQKKLELLIYVNPKKVKSVKGAVTVAQKELAVIKGVRDLVNLPANELSPQALVKAARKIARQYPAVKVQVWNKEKIKKENMGAFLAVARGSDEPPYVIRLSYRPAGAKHKVGLVGKGITFDSGGLSLKPAKYMYDMKIDMAGAAAVLGVFAWLGEVGTKVEVQGYIAACENMPSGKAYRPGDVVKSRSGKTIEIKNTDAEGRVTLADMLDVAVQDKPDYLIDLATLTGSCMVALGETVAGVMGNDQDLINTIKQAAAVTGEQVGELPLPEEYRKDIESKVADMCNVSVSDYGDAISAGLFLQEFVNNRKWAHLDIAGPAYMGRGGLLPYYNEGATGFGVRLLKETLKRLA